MQTDTDLLESYCRGGFETAFRELVERRVNLVYSAALRECGGDRTEAEDITQAVFTELARRAHDLRTHPALSGWLYTSVRRIAANARRREQRRRSRETKSFTMNHDANSSAPETLWRQVQPELDDAMHQLKEEDRTAVVLRFFEGRSFRDVGRALQLNENAARMRVERSLERLRGLLAARGVSSTGSALAAVLAGAVLAAPSSLAVSVTAQALMSVPRTGTAAIGSRLLEVAASKHGLAVAAGLLFLGVLTWNHVHRITRVVKPVVPLVPAAVASTAPEASPLSKEGTNVLAQEETPLREMSLRVVDGESGIGLPNSRLHLFYLLQDGRGETIKKVTEANGTVRIDAIQRPFRGLNLFVTAEGHVPKVATWGFGREMPAQYVMKLDRGASILGTVVNEAGEAVADAKVEFDTGGNRAGSDENIQFGPDTMRRTDADGNWTCNMIPKEADRVSLKISHPLYAGIATNIHLSSNPIKLVMRIGFTVSGFVSDYQGIPVPDAKIEEVNAFEETPQPFDSTDGQGRFALRHKKAGELNLLVTADGFAPVVRTVLLTNNLSGIRVRLAPGQILRGRVLDENGDAISNAFVETTRGRSNIRWSTRTDAEGRFEWDSAPLEGLPYSIQAEGYKLGYAVPLQADATEHEIKLARENAEKDRINITGIVTDADTGQPVDDFKVLLSERKGSEVAFPFEFLARGQSGRFAASSAAESTHPDYQIEIEKEGYLPALSKICSRNESSQSLQFKLQRGTGPSGIVLLPNGEPAIGATVWLCTSLAGVVLDGPAHVGNGNDTTRYSGRTDASGRFQLPAAAHPQGVIAIHDAGWAECSLRDLEAHRDLVLRRWGSISGRLKLDSCPVAGERVVAYDNQVRFDEAGRQFGFLSFAFEAFTDAAGRFTFDKVPEGSCTVFRQTLKSSTGFESHDTFVTVEPGVATDVLLGGSGRAVLGKIAFSGAAAPVDWTSVPVRLTLKDGTERMLRPKREDFQNAGAFIEASKRFFEAAHRRRRYSAFCRADGSFRVDDVPPGSYILNVSLNERALNSLVAMRGVPRAPEAASLVLDVNVPEDASNASAAEPVQLGTISLIPTNTRASLK